jgi:hypothetical protein
MATEKKKTAKMENAKVSDTRIQLNKRRQL